MSKETTMETTNMTTINPERLAELETLSLDKGGHASFSEGHCAMEAVAWLAGEAHSDGPACACPVVAKAVICLNDRIPDAATRTELLRPLLPRIVGSRASREAMVKRGLIAADMAVRVFAPLALEKRGRLDLAEKLRAVPEIRDIDSARNARKMAQEVRSDASAAYAAAYAAYAASAAYAAAAYAAYASAAYAYASAAYAADRSEARKPIWQLGVQMIERMLDVSE